MLTTQEERVERWRRAEQLLEDAWMVLWDYVGDYPEIKKAQQAIEEAMAKLDFAFQKYGWRE